MAKKKKQEEEEVAAGWDTSEVAEEEVAAEEGKLIPADDWTQDPLAETETKTVTVEIQIAKHTGVFNPTDVKMLIYGESGTGKTRLASTFPDVIFADIDDGMDSVTEKVDRTFIEEYKQLENFYQLLKHGEHSYKTVVIDTLNEMQRIAMRATIEDFPAIRRSYENLPSMSDYGKMLHDMVELTIDFIALPMRVILLAQVNSRQFDTDVLQPQLIGKNTARSICRKMDVIGYIYKSEKSAEDSNKKLSEIAFDVPQYVIKDRSYKLPAVLIDPSFSRISAFWE